MTLDGGMHNNRVVRFPRSPGIVERLEHAAYARLFVMSKQFGVAHVMANGDCTLDAFNLKLAGIITGGVKMKVPVCTEPFVITVDDFSRRADDVDTIVG